MVMAASSFDQTSSHNPATHVLVTRDCKRFRALVSVRAASRRLSLTLQPLAPLSNHFYSLLGAPTNEGFALRSAYGWSVVGGTPEGALS